MMTERVTSATLCMILALLPSLSVASGGENNEPPVRGVEGLLKSMRESCEQANEGVDFGKASVEDWCKIKAYARLGDYYPGLASDLIELEGKFNEQVGKTNQCRQDRDLCERTTAELNKRIGRKNARLENSVQRWKAVGLALGALVVGIGAGYAVGGLTGPNI